jgi:hypothetical protein
MKGLEGETMVMNDPIWIARMVLSSFNLVILAGLIYFFVRKYREVPSTFTLGFLLFALALFFRTLFAAPIIKVFLFGVTTSSVVDPYRMVADLFELASLLIFLYISTR